MTILFLNARPGMISTHCPSPTLGIAVSVLMLVLSGVSLHASAQTPAPDAGSLLQQQRIDRPPETPSLPASAPALGSRQSTRDAAAPGVAVPFTLKRLRLEGVNALDESALRAQLVRNGLLPSGLDSDTAIGIPFDLARGHALAHAIAEIYRASGYQLAYAYLPAQNLSSGELRICILEGYLAGQVIDNQSRISNAVVERLLRSAMPTGHALNLDEANRALYLLAEQPGVGGVSAQLKPGAEVGQTDLNVRLQPPPGAIQGNFGLSNYGSRYTGSWLLTSSVQANNLIGIADRLDATVVSSPGYSDTGHLGWSALLPTGGALAGLRGGFSIMTSHYKLGREFASLGASGESTSIGLELLWPVLRRAGHRLDLTGQWQTLRMQDDIATGATQTHRTVNTSKFAAEGSHLDSKGFNYWRLQLITGHLAIDGDDTARNNDAAGARTEGGFSRVNWQIGRLHNLPTPGSTPDAQLHVRVQGQLSSKNLDSSQQFVLGGPYGVRAHPTSEAIGDEGWLARLQWEQPIAAKWNAFAGLDSGCVRVRHDPFAANANNTLNRSGWALGMIAQPFTNTRIELTIAGRIGAPSTSTPDNRGRAWAMFTQGF